MERQIQRGPDVVFTKAERGIEFRCGCAQKKFVTDHGDEDARAPSEQEAASL